MTTIIADMITIMDSMLAPITPAGVTGTQFIAVFLIVYTISFLLLKNIKFLEDNKAARLMIALIIAYFTASSAFSVLFISKLFPNLGIVTMILLAFITVIVMIPDQKNKVKLGPILTLIGIGVIIYLTWTSMSGSIRLEGLQMPELTQSEWYGIIFLAIFIGIIMLIFLTGPKGDNGTSKDRLSNFMKFLLGIEED